MNESHEGICAKFLEHCHQVQSTDCWGRLAENVTFWKPPHDESATLAALQQEYDTQDLLESGVATYGDLAEGLQTSLPHKGKKELIVNPVLSEPFSQILPVRASAQSEPCDLLTGDGTASGRLPLRAALDDHLVQEQIQEAGFLCITFSMQDMMALRAVDVPAAPAKGLEQISRETLEDFCIALGLEAPDGSVQFSNHSAATLPLAAPVQEGVVHNEQLPCVPLTAMAGSNDSAPARPRLFLVGWSPSGLSRHRPGELNGVLRTLTNLGDALGIDLDDLFLWRPSHAQLRRIAYCLDNADRQDVQRAIVASIRGDSKLTSHGRSEVDEPGNLLEAQASLQEALLRSGTNPAVRRRRLRQHRQAVDSAFVTPLLELSAEEPDLKRRSRLAGLAHINQLLHPAVELHLAKHDKEVAKRGVEAWDQVSDVRDLMKLFDMLFKFTQDEE